MGLEGLKTFKDLEFAGKRVLIRVDFNVPLEGGKVRDSSRIAAAVPTIKAVLGFDAKQVILISHLGRPKGRDASASLKPVAEELSHLVAEPVVLADDFDKVPADARLVLLENIRFWKEEETNDDAFSKRIAGLCDVFVNDAFGTAHRAHASTVGVTKHVSEKGVGLLVQKEVESLDFSHPRRPFVALIGAAKISDKIRMLETLLEKVDKLLLGGGIVFTFLKARGFEVGSSLCEEGSLPIAKRLLEAYPGKIVLPDDIVISDDEHGREIFTVDADKIPPDMKGLDIGDAAVERYLEVLDGAATVFWNGPMGLFEVPPFDTATNEIAHHLAKSKSKVVVGGGDTGEVVNSLGLTRYFAHVSTGGGAALQLVAGETLVAIEALREK